MSLWDDASGAIGREPAWPARPRLGRFPGALLLAWLIAALSTVGCGFKLRGTAEIPPSLTPIHIAGGGNTAMGRALLERLQGSEVALTDDPTAARAIVRMRGEGRSSRVVAVDRNGKVLAYELGFQATFDAVAADGEALVAAQTVALERTLDNPDIEVLGKQEETELIYEDMEREAAELVLLRLRATLR